METQVPHLLQDLGIGHVELLLIGQLELGASICYERYHPLAPLQPPPDDVPLGRGPDTCLHKDLVGRLPLPIC